jgi:hypothetical protein
VKLICLLFFIVHWSSCIFYLVGYFELNKTPNCWIVNAGLQDTQDMTDIYLTSVYFVFLTIATIGFGDIVPITPDEKIFVMLVLVCACGVFAYMIGYIGSVLDKSNTIITEFK